MARNPRAFLGLCLLLITPTFSLDLAHTRRLRRQVQDDPNDDSNIPTFRDGINTDDGGGDRKGPSFSLDEFGEKLRELLDRDRPDGRDRGDNPWERNGSPGSFGALLNTLENLADHAPDDLTDFKAASFLNRVMKQGPRQSALNNRCLTNSVRLQTFMYEIRQAMRELRQDFLDDVHDADVPGDVTDVMSDVTDSLNTADIDTTDDRANFGLYDTNEDTAEDVSFRDDYGDDNTDMDEAFGMQNDMSDSMSNMGGSSKNSAVDDELDDIDVEDIFEKLSEASMECLSAFLDDDDEKMLCRRLSHQSSRIFTAFIHSGVDCSDYLDDGDSLSYPPRGFSWLSRNQSHEDELEQLIRDMFGQHNAFFEEYDDDDGYFREDLDDAHQMALLNQMLTKPASSWTTQDLQRAIRIAPDFIDDDLLDDFSDDIVDENLSLLGRVASRRGANPGLQLALRQRILGKDLSQLDSSSITRLGKGLFSLTEDQLDDLDPMALLDADLDDIFDDDDDEDDDDADDSDEDKDDNDDDDDDDDDDEEGLRLAIGRRMKQAQLSGPRQIGRVARFLYDDLDFLESVDPDDLYEAVDELLDLDLDDDDAANLFRRMSQSQSFPALNQFTRQDMQRLRGVLPGMSLSQLQQLPREVVRETLSELRDIDFGESQSRELLGEMYDIELSDLTAADLRGLGKLARGLDAEDIEDMDDNIISEVLDDIDDLDLNDAQKRLFAAKALNALNKQGAAKLMRLPGFADTVSIDDIDDLNDDEVVRTLNVSTRINWRPSQASSIVNKVKQVLGGRSLRPADIPNLGKLARGLLLTDLDDMVDKPDDIDDLADVLGDREDDLSSAQVDKVLDFIEDRVDIDDLPEVEVNAQFVAQKGIFLAYLPSEQFEKLEFDDGGKKAFVALMAKMNTRKLPRAQLKFLAEELLDMMEDKVGEDRDDSDFRKLRQLGEFSLGLSDDMIEKMSANAVLQNLGMLGTLPLTKDQAEAVMDKVEEAMPDWECKSSVIANVGPLLQFAREDTIEELCDDELASSFSIIEKRLEKRQERISERREEGLWREDSPDTPDTINSVDDITEDDTGKKRLVNRMLAAALARSASAATGRGRRRRAAGDQLTCSILRLMRQDVVLADVSMVTAMPDAEFRDCLEVLGNASKWEDKDLSILLRHAVDVIGSPSVWTNEIIRQAGVLVAGLRPVEIQTLQLTGVDAMNSVAKHARLDVAQLMAGVNRWLSLKKSSSISAVTPGEFSSMSEFVCGLTAAQINQLPLGVFKRSLDVVGNAISCTSEQRSAYATRALQTYGDNVLSWSPAVVGDMGHILGGLSSPSIQQLTADQLALVKPTVMASLPESTIKALSDVQLRLLSTNQVNALSKAQYSALSSEQQKILEAKATVSFNRTSGTQPEANTVTTAQSSTGSRTEPVTTEPDTTTEKRTTTTTTTKTTPTTSTTTTTTTTTTSTTTTTTTTTPRTTSTTKKPTTEKITPLTVQKTNPPPTYSPEMTEQPTRIPETPSTQDSVEKPLPKDVDEKASEKSTASPDSFHETTFPATTDEKLPATTTVRYIQTNTRKAIPVSPKRPDIDQSVTTASPSIKPDASRGENPWVKFFSKKPDSLATEKSTVTYKGSSNEGGQANQSSLDSENTVSSSSSSASSSPKQTKSGVSRNTQGTGSGAAMTVSWSLASLLVTVIISLILC